MAFTCPVCGFPGLNEPPRSAAGGGSYEICPSCGFQFGVSDDDRGETYAGWRARWLAEGARWHSANPSPAGWDPHAQLRSAGLGGERGQTAAELMGILLVIAAVVAAIFHSGLALQLAGSIGREVNCIGQGGCSAQASTGGGGNNPGGGPGGAQIPGTGSVLPGGGDPEEEGNPLLQAVQDAAEQAANRPGNGWGRPGTLQDHFDDHGGDFGSTSPEEYAQQARDFFQRAVQERLPTKIDPSDGTIRVYDPSTNEFGSYNPDGTTKTYFKPKRGPDYWDDQPGDDPYADEPGGGGDDQPGGGGDDEPGGGKPGAPGEGGDEPPPAEPEPPEVPEVPEVPEIPEVPIPELPIIIP